MQVRAGEGQSEADNYVLTNTVYKTSMSSGLSSKGKAQARSSSAPVLLRLYGQSKLVLRSRELLERMLHITLPVGCMPLQLMCAHGKF